jgi:hypothetical protein
MLTIEEFNAAIKAYYRRVFVTAGAGALTLITCLVVAAVFRDEFRGFCAEQFGEVVGSALPAFAPLPGAMQSCCSAGCTCASAGRNATPDCAAPTAASR